MTPDQLNRITKSVHADLEVSAIEPLAKAYRRLLRGAGRKMARTLRAKAVSLTASIVPPDEDEVIPQGLSGQVDRLTEKERAELVKLLIAAYEAHDIAFDVRPSITPELLDKVGAHAAFAAEEDLRQIYRGVIETASLEGYSIPRTANAIVEAVDGQAAYRATALARTDLIGLANGASQGLATTAFAGREDVTKIWLATNDDRTRETHVEADGQEVALNEFFDVGGYQAMYPGDPDLPDEEVINCRCTLIYSGGGEEPQPEDIVASVLSDAYSPAMPWHVVANHSECSDGKSYAVVKDADGSVAGCHATRAQANKQMSALYANEPGASTASVTITVEDDTATPDETRAMWEGILAIEGSPTSDGRYLIPGEIGARDLPLPIAPSHEAQHATDTVGRIDSIEHIPAAEFAKDGWTLPDDLPPQAVVIWGEGSFSDTERARDALDNGVGVSLDLPMERQALIDAQTYEEVDPSTLSEEQMLGMVFGTIPEGYLRGIAGKIGGASLASIAAFEETVIRIVEDSALVASGFAIHEREQDPLVEALTAAVATPVEIRPPIAPPRDWFFIEEPDEPTPLTIYPDGRFGVHLALWNTCHAGRANGAYSACMYAPHSRTGYSQWHLGAMLCDDGSEVPVGRLTIGTDHAPLNLGAAAARKHYDNTGTVVAFGRAYDGVFGIWVTGVIKSDATPEQIRDFRACPPSGDWRAYDGSLELQAALAVNVAGFPVARSQLALSASAESLEIATLILGAPDEEDFVEALRAEYDLQLAEDIDMLVELGVGEFCGNELAVAGRVEFRDYSTEERRRMARSGEAMPDGSFPIANCTDARNAISSQGRGGASQQRIVSHIRKRVGSLGCSGSVFDPYK